MIATVLHCELARLEADAVLSHEQFQTSCTSKLSADVRALDPRVGEAI